MLTKLQDSATLVAKWYDLNILQGNLKKYYTMNIRNKNTNCTDKTSITVNGKDIIESDSLKLLGVTIDCELSFNKYVSDVCMKASQQIGVIMRLRNLIPTEAKLQLYTEGSHPPSLKVLPFNLAFL